MDLYRLRCGGWTEKMLRAVELFYVRLILAY